MAQEPLILPACLERALKMMFPTLEFDRIEFVWDEAVSPPADASTRSEPFRTLIRVHPTRADPVCSTGFFLLIVHELVHALQIQSSGRWAHKIASNVCDLLHGNDSQSVDRGNCIEREAYKFQESATRQLTSRPPCVCKSPQGHPWLDSLNPAVPNPDPPGFPNQEELERLGMVKRDAGCGATNCFGRSIWDQIWGWTLTVIIAVGISVGYFVSGLVSTIGLVVGAATGLVIGAIVGGLIGGVLLIVIGAIIGAIIGAFLGGLIGSLIEGLADWLGGGPSGGSLNLLFSTNQGRAFGNKVTFERSREQPALALRSGPDRLFVGWTGTDSQVNVVTAPDKFRVAFELSDPSGVALGTGDGKVYVAWKGNDDHPNAMLSNDGNGFRGKFVSGGDGPRQSNMGLVFGNGMVYISWVGPDNRMRLAHLRPTDPLTEVPNNTAHWLLQRTGHLGTPALAFGDGRLFLAFSRFEPPHHIAVMEIPVAPDGWILPFDEIRNTTTTSDFTNDTTGPAIAYSERNHRLYLAFTGADDRLYVISSRDNGKTFPDRHRLDGELSRHDTGPAIAVHPDGLVALCWVGADGD